jgi:hypothetical protein
MATLPSKTLTLSIDRPPTDVYAFVSDPRNLPKWAKAFCKSVRQSGDDWILDTPQGPVKFRFLAPNPFGILDHRVCPAPGVEILVPMRVIPNASGSEILFTLFQLPGTSDAAFAQDANMVQSDLATLKQLLEHHHNEKKGT